MDDEQGERPRRPTWEALLRAMTATMDRGYELVMVSAAFPGNGFETWTVTVRKGGVTRTED